MNFSIFRKKYTGPVNKMAYLGMLGDIVVVTALWALWRERKKRTEAKKPIIRQEEIQKNLYFK